MWKVCVLLCLAWLNSLWQVSAMPVAPLLGAEVEMAASVEQHCAEDHDAGAPAVKCTSSLSMCCAGVPPTTPEGPHGLHSPERQDVNPVVTQLQLQDLASRLFKPPIRILQA